MTPVALATDPDRHLDADGAERAEVEANQWIKQLRHARVNGQTFRDRFTCRGDSLWWFAELYLHKRRVIVEAFRARYALERLISNAPGGNWNLNGATPVVACVARQIASRAFDCPSRGGASLAVGLPLARREYGFTVFRLNDAVG
jgi:hypothetical protein